LAALERALQALANAPPAVLLLAAVLVGAAFLWALGRLLKVD